MILRIVFKRLSCFVTTRRPLSVIQAYRFKETMSIMGNLSICILRIVCCQMSYYFRPSLLLARFPHLTMRLQPYLTFISAPPATLQTMKAIALPTSSSTTGLLEANECLHGCNAASKMSTRFENTYVPHTRLAATQSVPCLCHSPPILCYCEKLRSLISSARDFYPL